MRVEKLEDIVGKDWVITEEEQMVNYLTDETATEVRPQPASELVLIKPANSQEVSSILELANYEKTPVFPRGGGTGLCGGAIPTENGIILSLERMNKIDVDKDNLMALVEAGATLRELTEKVEREDLFFPPHPGDESAQVGGLVACNAGGSRAVKYGIMRSYVKGLEVVLSTGKSLRLGGELLKNNTGYDLMHLIIGSEGTLAVITKVILRLFPPLAASATMIIPYNNRHDAINTVPKVLQSGITPLAIEYIERSTIEISAEHLGLEWPCKIGTAHLMITVEGKSKEEIYSQCERISEICKKYRGLEAVIGETKKQQDRILKIRSNLYPSLKHKLLDALDVAVPPANMGRLMDAIDKIAERFGTTIPIYGHAGDGNLHPHLMRDLIKGGKGNLKAARREIYEEAVKLGGVMAAEHGLGRIRIEDLDICMDKKEMELMRGIKKVFDPNGILNPGCAIEIREQRDSL